MKFLTIINLRHFTQQRDITPKAVFINVQTLSKRAALTIMILSCLSFVNVNTSSTPNIHRNNTLKGYQFAAEIQLNFHGTNVDPLDTDLDDAGDWNTKRLYYGDGFNYELKWDLGLSKWTLFSWDNGTFIATHDDDTPYPPTDGWVITSANALVNANPGTVLTGITLSGSHTTAVLPVELLHFSAKNQDHTVQLTWATASEENNSGFEVQRSTDAETFETLAFVEGNGTTLERQEYFYNDNALYTNQTYYYRLKQIDYDGQFEYSEVITATFEDSKATVSEFYPNPTLNGSTTLNYTATADATLSITIYSITGQLLHTENKMVNAGDNTLTFDVSNLPKGTAFVKLSDDEGSVSYRKLVIE